MAYVPSASSAEMSGYYAPEMGNFWKSLKKWKPLKTVAKAAKIVTTPVRAVASTVVSTVSPKLAHEITPEISKSTFNTVGKIGDVAAVVAGAVVAAPVIAGAISSVGSATGLTGTLATVAKTKVGQLVQGLLSKGQQPPAYSDLSADQQAEVSPQDYSAYVASVAPAAPAAANPKDPYANMTEAELEAEKTRVDSAISAVNSGMGIEYSGESLTKLLEQRAMIMYHLTPMLVKKYSLYAAAGLGGLLLVMLVAKK